MAEVKVDASDYTPEQAQHDAQLLNIKQKGMGSTILFGALNDLDLGEAKIPDYSVPGVPNQQQV